MSADRRLVELSKWLSWALRHDPTAAGIELNPEGWVPVEQLLSAAECQGRGMTSAELERIVEASDKKRFAVSGDGLSIRANQGHSVPVDLGLEPQVPPAVLFHGTADRFVESILREGLQRQARHHVHLSAERATAAAVGTRHGRLIVLTVDALQMHGDGHRFYRSANGVWLADAVPAAYLRREQQT